MSVLYVSTVKTELRIEIIHRDPIEGIFVSFCPALGVYSQGETEVEALEAIKDAVELYVTWRQKNQSRGIH